MTVDAIEEALREAEEFIQRGKLWRVKNKQLEASWRKWKAANFPDEPERALPHRNYAEGTRESGDLRRKSMDLTRALTRMRKP